MFATFEEPIGELFLTEQMSLKKGLKYFGKSGTDAVIKELWQLDYRNVIKPVPARSLTREQKHVALNYLMYLKQKCCGRIKAWGCADGRKQRLYKSTDETSSPMVSTEAVFLTAIINAQEQRQVMTINIPGAFMHVDIDELIHVHLEGPMAVLLARVDPEKYRTYMTEKMFSTLSYRRHYTVHCRLPYYSGRISWSFWPKIEELGFVTNPYDSCVVNKIINGKQCTIIWHVDDLKLSHVEQQVLEDIANKLNTKYGQQTPIVIHRGKIHDYLGMTIDYSEDGKVKLSMPDYVEGILDEALTNMDRMVVTPVGLSLFTKKKDDVDLDDEDAETYHRLTVKLLYLCKQARPDLQLTVAYLITWLTQPNVDDWKKLTRGIQYLRGSKELYLTLEANDGRIDIKWWVDASFAVHPDMRSHTGGTMLLGKGLVYSLSWKQRINTKSSMEAELVGIDDSMPLVVWTRNFITAQGYDISDNVIFQDNQSAMLLEKNGKASSGRLWDYMAQYDENSEDIFVTDSASNLHVGINTCSTYRHFEETLWQDTF
jgi:hypothetical protein